MIISALYLLVRCLLSCLTVLARHQGSKDAELLVLRHENAVLRLRADQDPGAVAATARPAGPPAAGPDGCADTGCDRPDVAAFAPTSRRPFRLASKRGATMARKRPSTRVKRR